MKMSMLSQFDVISIIPLWMGNNEISIIKLSLTVGFVVLIKTDITKLYSNLEVLRNFQVISVLNFSTSKLSLGGIYSSRLMRVQALQFKKKYNCKEVNYDNDSFFGSINDHPFIPSIISVNKKFYLFVNNLTTKPTNADLIAEKKVLHPESAVYLFKKSRIIWLNDKKNVNNIIIKLKESKENIELSNNINNNDDVLLSIEEYSDIQIKSHLIKDDYVYFSKNEDVVSTLNEVKKVID